MKTTYADFSSTQQLNSVLSAYSDIFPRINTLRNELYLSSPMTSGGARRLFSNSELSETEIVSASISHNRKLSEVFLEYSDELLPENVVASPFHFKQPGWTQYEYNLFWMYYISGISTDDVATFDASNTVSQLKKLHMGASGETIKDLYAQLVDAFIEYSQNSIQLNPVSRVLFFPDHTVSLGCHLEKTLSLKLGIPTYEIVCNMSHHKADELFVSAPWIRECEQLVHDENHTELFVLRQISDPGLV